MYIYIANINAFAVCECLYKKKRINYKVTVLIYFYL